MNQTRQISAIIIFTLLVVFPSAAMSEVKITLKNGRDIIADRCIESKDMLICDKMGGTFEIGKKDIANLKEITITKQEEPSRLGEETTDEKPVAGEKNSNQESEGRHADLKVRLKEINQRKTELIPIRESLINEREMLNAEAKARGGVSQQVFESYRKKFNEIDAKINSFNTEIKKLDEEEQSILKDMSGSSESVK